MSTLNEIKTSLRQHQGDQVKLTVNCSRNRVEHYDAQIKDLYNFVFTVEVKDENNSLKSFTYSDILTNTVELNY